MTAPLSEASHGMNQDRVIDALSGCKSFDDVRSLGILFHGTCEEIDGPLRGGSYDGVFWAAETPSVAQGYIPRSGSRTWVSRPRSYEVDDKIRPGKDLATRWALSVTGATLEDMDISWENHRAVSWRTPRGWPTMGDFDAHVRSLGYEAEAGGNYEVSQRLVNGAFEIAPADWRLPGRLLIILAEDLEIRAPEWSEEARGYSNHNRVGDFARFAREGVEAFGMSDQLQSDYLGNVGHRAIGILPAGLRKLSWVSVPAVRHDGEDLSTFSEPETEAFLGLMSEIAPVYRPSADQEDAPSPW